MSESPLDDKLALLNIANEYNRLNRQLDSKTQQLEALLEANGEAGDFPTDFVGMRNRRYNIDFSFKPGVQSEDFVGVMISNPEPQERSVTIESGTIFRCAAVETFLRAVGDSVDTFSGDPVAVQMSLSWDQRVDSFDYMWSVRDTGTDREWVNCPQPSLFGGGGYVGPLWLPRRIVLSGNTVLFAYVDPFLSKSAIGPNNQATFTVEEYILQMSFIGHEMPDRSAL